MEHLKTFESYGQKEIVLSLKNRPNMQIRIIVKNNRIAAIENPFNLRFPYRIGEAYNRGIETFCANNNFLIDGVDVSPEPKIFGMRQRDIPMGHELRQIYRNKFKK